MQSRHDGTPAKIFRQMVVIHAGLAGSIVAYMIAGGVIKWMLSPFDGLASDTSLSVSILRGLFLGMSAFELLVVLLFRTNRFMKMRLTGYVDVNTSVFLQAMMNRSLSTSAPLASIGVYGLVLFVYGGELLHLYSFCAVSFTLLLLFWPRRSEWEATFREFAAEHPAIPSNPWQPGQPLIER